MTQKQKLEYIESLVAEAKDLLFLSVYDIPVELSDEPEEDGADAVCRTAHPYLNARVIVYPPFWNRTKERQRHVIIHEVAHILTQPTKAIAHRLSSDKAVTWSEVCDNNEQLTDWIARIAART